MNRHLHIVCLDVPWPADYGKAIDRMNRIRAFHKKGIKIQLHYFSCLEGSMPNELNTCCDKVHIYSGNGLRRPFAVNTQHPRPSETDLELVNNLRGDEHPILLEGLCAAGTLTGIDIANRKICVRMHNEDRDNKKIPSHNFLKKIYYAGKGLFPKQNKTQLPASYMYACISNAGKNYLQSLGLPDVRFIPAFPSWQKVNALLGAGNFCLFHGNLSVPENEKAALWLLCHVFNKVRVPFVIAGKNPSKRLHKAASLCQHTCLVSDPEEQEMNDLIQKAHINILPCLHKNRTDVSLKLLHALFEGRHCVVTPSLVNGTGLEEACHIGKTANALASIVAQLYYRPFEEEEIVLREKLLYGFYKNDSNIDKFIDFLW